MENLIAQSFCNPLLTGSAFETDCTSGSTSAGYYTFGKLVTTIISSLINIAGVLVLIYMAWGALSWITSGGDPAKVQSARDRITSAIIGMAVLFSVVAVSALVDNVFGTNILNLNIARNI